MRSTHLRLSHRFLFCRSLYLFNNNLKDSVAIEYNSNDDFYHQPQINDVETIQQQPTLFVSKINYAKSFSDVSKIEVFNGQNFCRWYERVQSILDMHSVASSLSELKPMSSTTQKVIDQWTDVNKVCRYTILSNLSNNLFDV